VISFPNIRRLTYTDSSTCYEGMFFESSDLVEKSFSNMEVFLDVVQIGNFRVELIFHENHGCSVVFTAQDVDNRRLIKAPIMEDGQVKIYSNAQDALSDAFQKFGSMAQENINKNPQPLVQRTG
jgi:hypothetical protein